MKAFFITGSIVFTVIMLILAFENMGVTCSGFLFIFLPLDSPFVMTFMLSGVGIISGLLYAGLLGQIMRSKSDDEESPGGEW